MSRKQELWEEIDQLQWELANACYMGYEDHVIAKIAGHLFDLQDELDELDQN